MKRIAPPVSTDRLRQLSHAVTEQDWSEFSMRVPVETQRDADVVLSVAADEIEALRDTVAELQSVLRHEAKYCYRYAVLYMFGDQERAARHRERGDRLMAAAQQQGGAA